MTILRPFYLYVFINLSFKSFIPFSVKNGQYGQYHTGSIQSLIKVKMAMAINRANSYLLGRSPLNFNHRILFDSDASTDNGSQISPIQDTGNLTSGTCAISLFKCPTTEFNNDFINFKIVSFLSHFALFSARSTLNHTSHNFFYCVDIIHYSNPKYWLSYNYRNISYVSHMIFRLSEL